MKVFDTLEEWIEFRKSIPSNKSLGFAPTMGNLHQGHASLFLKSREENDWTISSLFVNPTQFNQADDFKHYPRTLEQDFNLMTESGVDFCILPSEKAIYPDNYRYRIDETDRSQNMEGQHRPGHFQGVLTVVMKLLNLCQATRAYFGEKDFQQALLIQGMVKAFFLTTEIKICPTIRENTGLAYSSRNNRLSDEQRILADEFAAVFHQRDKTCADIAIELKQKGILIEYIEEHDNRRFAAVVMGSVRLIDNYAL